MDKPSGFPVGLPISSCVLGSAFYELIKLKEVLHPNDLQNYHDPVISSLASSVFNGVLVLSEIEVSTKTGGLGSTLKES